MSWRRKTVVVAGTARELVLRRSGKFVEVDHIRRTTNSVSVFSLQFLVLKGGRTG